MHVDLLTAIGLAVVIAAALAIAAHRLGQPLIMAYLAAGIVLGSKIGFGLIPEEAVTIISEIGLVLLLYIIGLEIDVKKIAASGKTLFISGFSQFLLCVVLGLPFFMLTGFALGQGRFDALYMAVAAALSSTMIVVKLLYDKRELSTLAGRITIAVLVFQDIWAILFLSVQPNLLDPKITVVLLSFAKGAALVVGSLCFARYVLTRLFAAIARTPELMLTTAVAWCFLVSGVAEAMHLSREMGALVAGISLSTFPYNMDVIAKVINIRDFFTTLFFVGLGMQIPMPTPSMLGYALLTAFFLVVSRFLSVFPVLYLLGSGLRVSALTSINLAQLGEFSLVIASIGLGMGHVGNELIGILTICFTITSIFTGYAVQASHILQQRISRFLRARGFKDISDAEEETSEHGNSNPVTFLGFFQESSSIYCELEDLCRAHGARPEEQVRVIDFSPAVYAEMARRNVCCTYGDIASHDTLSHAGLRSSRVIVCSITDSILKGTTNERLLQYLKRECPESYCIVTANRIPVALRLYDMGADFVFIPRMHSARNVAEVIMKVLHGGEIRSIREGEAERLRGRREVLA